MSVDLIVLGGGGHAAVVIDALLASDSAYALGLTDSDRRLMGGNVLGVPVLGTDEDLPALIEAGARYFTVGLGGMRDTQPRRRLFERGVALGLIPVTVIHPSAIVSAHASIRPGCQVLAGAIVNPRAVVGENTIVNTGAIVEHDCRIGSHAHVSVGAKLAGRVAIGEAAHIGIGAVVLQCRSVGSRAIVGAGAVVVRDVAADSLVVGIPARPLGDANA